MYLPITPLRQKISDILEKDWKAVVEVEGIKLLEKRDPDKDHRNALNCITYLLGRENKFNVDLKKAGNIPLTSLGHFPVEEPQERDLVIYIVDNGGREQAHVGRYLKSGNVHSKWSYGHIYEHPLGLVPVGYGEEVLFFRPTEKRMYLPKQLRFLASDSL